ncbi:protein kinase [Granulicella sp. S190]|uniref:protein kinase domain-containing protein n=1 Tax=Granulicella sp. S190 TaxID=1747226 RepID=UPI0020B17479|nr:protein kinase [Granulicella sp. S190]
MGVVWRAYDSALNIDVALKMLLDVHDAAALELFYEECRKQSALAHPNIVEIRDTGSFDGDGVRSPYLVMPLLHGRTLSALIRSSTQPLSNDRCMDIIAQAGRGLQAAHDAGLLHRDIKPSNLFVLEDDSVKLLDFGVALQMDVSRTVGRKGTLLYMSPEQLAMRSLTRSSDVFSLAVVCYEMLTRKQPFMAASEEGVVEAIRKHHPPLASSLNSNVSVTLSQVLCVALAKDPAHRFSSVKEFNDALRRAHYDPLFMVFDPTKFKPRLEKATAAYEAGNFEFAQELLGELQSEGFLTEEFTALAEKVQSATKKRDIERLLASARARVQDGEDRLALQRVSEALDLDPRQEDALVLRHDIEARRAEADVVDWLRIGHQHLEKLSFVHAREVAQRILEAHPEEDRALRFISLVERRESEVQRILEQKKEAYAEALDAEKHNEITAALSKMKMVLALEQQAPDGNKPKQLAVFQSFYNKLLSEHEAIAASYTEATQSMERGDYAITAELCDRFLERFPQHTLFKALKFDVDQRRRRSISARLIKIEEAVENEPDLDRRVAMLEEVVRESPTVLEFSRLLEATQQKSSLVNGIVSRARELEARQLHGEALVQWETLQTIYPEFPGLSIEVENQRLRWHLSERLTRKNQLLSEIREAPENCEFDNGLRLLATAMEEFPQDVEFVELHAYLQQKQELAAHLENLLQDGRRSLDDGDVLSGLEKLRTAYNSGTKTRRAKTELIEGLLRAARASQGDERQARAYLLEILNLDPGNHAAKGMLQFLEDQSEYRSVDEVLSRALQLRNGNNLRGSIGLLESALREYPCNTRLRKVLNEMDAGPVEIRTRALEAVRRKRLEEDSLVSAPSIQEHAASIERTADRYKEDEEFQVESRILRARLQTIATTAPENSAPSREQHSVAVQLPKKANRRSSTLITGCIAAMLLAGVVLIWHKSHKRALPAQLASATVNLRTVPVGASIFLDGKELGKASPLLGVQLPEGKTTLQAQLPGYESVEQVVDVAAGKQNDFTLALVPVAQQLQIIGAGRLRIDGGRGERVRSGQITATLSPGPHTLLWKGATGSVTALHVQVEDGKPASLSAPLAAGTSGPVLVVSVAGGQGAIYTNPGAPVQLDGTAKGIARREAMAFDLPSGFHVATSGREPDTLDAKFQTGPGRLLLVVFDKLTRFGSLTVLSNMDGADLKLLHGATIVREGKTEQGRFDIPDLPAGTYTLKASMSGADTIAPQSIIIKNGDSVSATLLFNKNAITHALCIHTVPDVEVLMDGHTVGRAGSDGTLTLPAVAIGTHHLEARHGGKASVQDVTLSEADGVLKEVSLKLDDEPGAVTLQLAPAETVVTAFNPDGKQVPLPSAAVGGAILNLPEGRYRFVATADGYTDRTETVDVIAGKSATVNLTLTPVAFMEAAPTIEGWDKGEWNLDAKAHTLTHNGGDIGFYSVQPERGRYTFGGSLGRGFLLNRPRVEWVVNYRGPDDYLLFSLDHTGLELFSVVKGKKISHGTKIELSVRGPYKIMVNVEPQRIKVSLLESGAWKLLHDWTDLPADDNQGKFGFKGAVTLSNFNFSK